METARHLLRTGRFLYVIFMCHLVLEKTLKAHLASKGQPPVRTHDLILLVRRTGFDEMPGPFLDFLGKLGSASLPTRYPDDLRQAIEDYPEPVAQRYLEQTEEVFLWLRSRLS
ncbi:MAG: HEPN domain-containing protein [Armatimonadetes bacterium]|nr:HEPN domain-containing protein [Armatimonadota bacterium]